MNNFTTQEVKNFWDNIATEYNRINSKIGKAHFQRFHESVDRLGLKGSKEETILNIWSRTGNAIPFLREKYPQIKIDNLEVSGKMIEIAKQNYPQEKFLSTDLISLQYNDNTFDAILSLETLEHSPDPEKFILELYRVLKPGKLLVMSLPPRTAELPLKIYEFFFENHGEGPHRFLPSKEVKKLLSSANFKLIEHKGTLLIPVGPELIQNCGEKIINFFQKTPLKELGIRQFYIAQK